ncbi:unnamed protein product [Prunus armeniaca]
MSGGSESDDSVTANGRVYIPEVRNEETPAVGMKFDSLDLVYNFYNRYAFLASFGIRLHSSFWGKNKKEILRKEFVCCKQGAYRNDETRERKRQRGIKGHNHKMTPSGRMHLLRSHRRISNSTKVLTKQLGSVNIPINQKDMYNLECSVNGKLRNHDVELVTKYFMAEQKKNEAFYFKIEGDGDNRFSRCFWADATSRRAYGFYGDVVVFDTTFNTNRYDLTFAPMLGEFKKAMPGGEPKTIITDQDAAISRAISIAFPTTFHRLCIWHITSKFSVKLPHSAYKEYWGEFQKAIWDTDNKDEFDAKWNIVVTKAGLTDHPWLSSMFDLRESWVPAYARHFFAAGMSSSQRDLLDRKILKFPEKTTMGVDKDPFPNAQVNMVNANFPRPDQPRPRLDLGGSARAAAERRAREIPADPKAKGKAKMYPEMAKVPETKGSTKEEPPKAIVLCSRCQCEVTLEVVSPKPKEPTKDQVQVGRSRSFEKKMITSPARELRPT